MTPELQKFSLWMDGVHKLVVYDLEWTSWPGFWESNWSMPGKHREVIQIGAVKIDCTKDFQELEFLDVLIRPQRNPVLSPYILQLTGLSAKRIENEGVLYEAALAQFANFCSDADYMCFNGEDDIVITENCVLNDLPCPQDFAPKAKNLRMLFTEVLRIAAKDLNSCDLTSHFGLPKVGQHHDGLADARGIAAAIKHLRKLKRE